MPTRLPLSESRTLLDLPPTPRYERASALVLLGWPRSAVAHALEIPESTLRLRLASHPARTTAGVPAPPSLTSAHTRRLVSLQQAARTYRSQTPAGAPSAQAQKALDELISDLEASGISLSAIADTLGVSYQAARKRLLRHRK